MPKPPKPWRWGWASQETALRNARLASAVLEQRRREREEVEAYFAGTPVEVTALPG